MISSLLAGQPAPAREEPRQGDEDALGSGGGCGRQQVRGQPRAGGDGAAEREDVGQDGRW